VSDTQERQERPAALQKRVSLKQDGYYGNCTIVEMTPFDIGVLFGKIRPVANADGQASVVEMYDRQVCLSHWQAKA